MFGFSLSEIFFTAVIVVAIFWIYRQINRIDGGLAKSKVKAERKAADSVTETSGSDVQDLTSCPVCGSYVAAGSNPGCGRAAKDCPMQK